MAMKNFFRFTSLGSRNESDDKNRDSGKKKSNKPVKQPSTKIAKPQSTPNINFR